MSLSDGAAWEKDFGDQFQTTTTEHRAALGLPPNRLEPSMNTDRELWRENPNAPFSDSIHVTRVGSIGIQCGGFVIVKPAREWHKLAKQSDDAMRALENLTVGGSEFVGDVENCVVYIRKKQETLQDIAKRATIEKHKLQDEVRAALALLNQHLTGRVYDNLDDALRNLLQAYISMRDE